MTSVYDDIVGVFRANCIGESVKPNSICAYLSKFHIFRFLLCSNLEGHNKKVIKKNYN